MSVSSLGLHTNKTEDRKSIRHAELKKIVFQLNVGPIARHKANIQLCNNLTRTDVMTDMHECTGRITEISIERLYQ